MEILDAFELPIVATRYWVYLIIGKITSKNRVLWGFQLLGQKYATGCFKMQFWGWKQKEHIRNDLNLTGFALKHHQNDSKQLFWKVKILHFFQNFKFQKWEFSFSFSPGNGSWKSQKLEFCQNSRFSNRDVVLGQTC